MAKQLTRDRIARAERRLARRPLVIVGLSARECARLRDQMWHTKVGDGVIETTMAVLPLAAVMLCALRDKKSVTLRIHRGRYSLWTS